MRLSSVACLCLFVIGCGNVRRRNRKHSQLHSRMTYRGRGCGHARTPERRTSDFDPNRHRSRPFGLRSGSTRNTRLSVIFSRRPVDVDRVGLSDPPDRDCQAGTGATSTTRSGKPAKPARRNGRRAGGSRRGAPEGSATELHRHADHQAGCRVPAAWPGLRPVFGIPDPRHAHMVPGVTAAQLLRRVTAATYAITCPRGVGRTERSCCTIATWIDGPGKPVCNYLRNRQEGWAAGVARGLLRAHQSGRRGRVPVLPPDAQVPVPW